MQAQFSGDDSLSALLLRIKALFHRSPSAHGTLIALCLLCTHKLLLQMVLLDFLSMLAAIPHRFVYGAAAQEHTARLRVKPIYRPESVPPFIQHPSQICWSTNFVQLPWPFFGLLNACLLTKTARVQSQRYAGNGEHSVPKRKQPGFALSTCV